MLKHDTAHKFVMLFKSYNEGFDEYLNLVRDKEKFGDEKVEELRLNAEKALLEYVDALGDLYYKMEQDIEAALKHE